MVGPVHDPVSECCNTRTGTMQVLLIELINDINDIHKCPMGMHDHETSF